MTPDEFGRHLHTAGHVSRETLSPETVDRLTVYADTLRAWQPRINLVSNKSLDDLWRRHFLDSAQLARWIACDHRVLDLGSGAGFPGLVLAIVTGASVVLAESDARKCAFLREVRRLTDAPAEVAEGRIENLETASGFDVVTARALTTLSGLLDHAAPHLKSDGFCLFSKGARARNELTDAKKVWNMKVNSYQSLSGSGGTVLQIGNLTRGRPHDY
ncbi:MAG: 16S rRNA (guanine(527)-N(7))-methyltransferase RsmG [Alphaproteobacteria bacterium]|nr:16S rRNA (guanine(527)-N(7))-methyltransferase RsmG [Alphaproteobacteria bacterium]HCP01484.1 16S rRNA (guanine(527)-N(7))-methyltransferase RsmG [Rhodospirillaceae bacterium]